MCCMFFSTHGIEGERDAAIVTSSSKQFNTDADAWFPNSETRLAINGDIEGMSGEQHIRMRISVATSVLQSLVRSWLPANQSALR